MRRIIGEIMKIGILNMQYGNYNYGAVLQAAALADTLNKMGCEVEHINFLAKSSPTIRQRLAIGTRLRAIKRYLLKLLGKSFPQVKITGNEVFEEFRLKWLERTPSSFLYSKDLKKHKFNYDAVVVGSDQVWRWRYLRKNITAFFFDFISSPTKKIAYAASFGLDYFELDKNNTITKKIKNLINQFSAISVREHSGVKICKEVFDVNAVQVIDPTLLAGVEFFDKIIETENLLESEKNSDIAFCMLDNSEFLKRVVSGIIK